MRLPHALGEPCAARTNAQMTFEVIREARDLFQAIGRRNCDENRLVESAPAQSGLPLANQRARAIEVCGAISLDPFEQAAAEMHAEANRRMCREHVEKRQIALRVGALDHVVEIADGLVSVIRRVSWNLRNAIHSGTIPE